MTTVSLSNVQKTLLDQVMAQFQNRFAYQSVVHTVVSIDENTLKFFCYDKNVQIRYDYGKDAYQVHSYDFRSKEENYSDEVYCDQLGDYFID